MLGIKGKLALGIALAMAGTAAHAQQSQMSEDEQLSCTVVLCMANPDGFDAIQQCREPVEKWMERKRRGKSTPPCPGTSNNGGGGGSGPGGGGRGEDPEVPREVQ